VVRQNLVADRGLNPKSISLVWTSAKAGSK